MASSLSARLALRRLVGALGGDRVRRAVFLLAFLGSFFGVQWLLKELRGITMQIEAEHIVLTPAPSSSQQQRPCAELYRKGN